MHALLGQHRMHAPRNIFTAVVARVIIGTEQLGHVCEKREDAGHALLEVTVLRCLLNATAAAS